MGWIDCLGPPYLNKLPAKRPLVTSQQQRQLLSLLSSLVLYSAILLHFTSVDQRWRSKHDLASLNPSSIKDLTNFTASIPCHPIPILAHGPILRLPRVVPLTTQHMNRDILFISYLCLQGSLLGGRGLGGETRTPRDRFRNRDSRIEAVDGRSCETC